MLFISPDFPTFVQQAEEANLVPLHCRLTGDTLTPVTAFHRLLLGESPGTDSFLFESVGGGERLGRFSFMGTGPWQRIQAWGEQVELAVGAKTRQTQHADPLAVFAEELGRWTAKPIPGLPRFTGGAVGYAGYDVVRFWEKLPFPPPDDRKLPDLSFAFYDRMVIFDHLFKTILVVAYAHVPPGADRRQAYAHAQKRLEEYVSRLSEPTAELPLAEVPSQPPERPWSSNFTQAAFEAAVRKCQEYILAGDIFQVVLSQRLQTQTQADPFSIYRALRLVNPSPFMFCLQAGPVSLVGSSPEIMVRVEGRTVTTRPLAGTRRRGATEEEDARLAAELLADPKERAEHIMLVDLGRNDVGRIAQFGTVELAELMTVEKYSHVMHLSSTVRGQLAEGRTALDALRACLPAGTLSGAPKVRAMQIIDELEPHRRGPYGGAVGYLDFTGNMDTCIALRTLVLTPGHAYMQAGAGVVQDSQPAAEFEETLNKAKGLLKAVALAEAMQQTATKVQ